MARHLGWEWDLKSRLARARERLRGRFIVRVMPSAGGGGVGVRDQPAEAAERSTLTKSTALSAARYVTNSAAMGGMVPPSVVELPKGRRSQRITRVT